MSWTLTSRSIMHPYFLIELTTNNLQYKDDASFKKAIITCHGCASGLGCSTKPSCNHCTDCGGVDPDICSGQPISVLNIYQGAVVISSNTDCDGESCYTIQGDPYPGTKYVFNETKLSVCARVDGVATPTLLPHGSGIIQGGTPIQGTNWNLTTPNSQYMGWMLCEYEFDSTNYNSNIQLQKLTDWLTSIYIGTNPSAPQGMDPIIKNNIRDSTIIFFTLLDFYNQIWNTGYYSSYQSPFSSINFMFGSHMDNFISNSINAYGTRLSSCYPPSGLLPDLLRKSLISLMQPPVVEQKSDDYYMTVRLNFPQYANYVSIPEDKQVQVLQYYLNNLLRDDKSKFNDGKSSWTPGGPGISLLSPSVEYITAVNINDYTIADNIPPPSYTVPAYDSYIFGTYNIKVKITTWSPALVVYFQTQNTAITFSPTVCGIIASQSGVGSSHGSTLPVSCLRNDCFLPDKSKCRADKVAYCPIYYTTPSYMNRTQTDSILTGSNTQECLCYNSLLQPSVGSTPGNPAAMCFDKNCTPLDRSEYGLSDSICSGYCDTVWDWLHSTYPPNQSQNATEADIGRLGQVCGKNFSPYTPKQFNFPVLIGGIILSILLLLFSFSVMKHKGYSNKKILIILILLFIVFVAGSIFFGRDMAGISTCDSLNKKFSCKSRITNMTIPNTFCNYILRCECIRDEDCSGGCICQSEECQPTRGYRKVTTVYNRNPNYPLIGLSVLVLIFFPLAMFYLYEDYHWHIPKKILIPIVLVLSAIPLVYSLYTSIKKNAELKYDPACSSNPCDLCSPGQTCMDDGSCCTPVCPTDSCGGLPDTCGGNCPKCDDYCLKGVCIEPCKGFLAQRATFYPFSQNTRYRFCIQKDDNNVPKFLALDPDNFHMILIDTVPSYEINIVTIGDNGYNICMNILNKIYYIDIDSEGFLYGKLSNIPIGQTWNNIGPCNLVYDTLSKEKVWQYYPQSQRIGLIRIEDSVYTKGHTNFRFQT